MEPTQEQTTALDIFSKGVGLAIEAGAGTGKTATMKLLAESTTRRGQYVAFNKAIVEEAKAKMPANITASTMHSLAMKAKGREFAHRLTTPRMKSSELARILKLDPIFVKYIDQTKVVQPATQASLVMRAIGTFCNSADTDPSRKHIAYIPGIDEADSDGRHGWSNNNLVRDALVPALADAWADLNNPAGRLPFKHDHYLKMWELDSPRINADFILFDEAQDAAPVMASIVFQQTKAQLVVVGDSNQAIYEWRGAVDALAKFKETGVEASTLSKSFRFGQGIADVANLCLEECDTDLRMTGLETLDSKVGEIADADVDAILCRTNSEAVSTFLKMLEVGRKVHLLGGGGEVLAFAKAARQLQDGGWCGHQDLVCFSSWGEVQDYVDQDPSGDELRLLVNLIDEFGADVIVAALERMPREDQGALVISTAHKAKGREWDHVRLAGDFPDPEDRSVEVADWRLLYVAATRARKVLDIGACQPLVRLIADAEELAEANAMPAIVG